MEEYGYNIYVCGEMGTGKTTSAKELSKKIASTKKAPDDFIYVYNFISPKEPILINLPNGMAEVLKYDLEEIITMLQVEIPKVYFDKNLENKKNGLLKSYQAERDDIIKELSKDVEKENFGVRSSATGIYLMPIKDGQIISEDDFSDLPDDEKDFFSKSSLSVNLKAESVLEKLKEREKVLGEKLQELDFSETLFIVGRHFTKLIDKYHGLNNEKLNKYLFDMKEDVLDNIDEFLNDQVGQEAEQNPLASLVQKVDKDEFLQRYKINIFVNNKGEKHPKVIFVENPTYTNLFGEIECETEGNAITTSFLKIKSGAFSLAHDGYIIINSYDLLTNPGCYEALRRILKTKKIMIDTQREMNTGTSFSIMKPEDMDFSSKIILVGNYYNYQNISSYDDDFNKFFKVLAQFEYEMDFNEKNAEDLAHFVCDYVNKNNISHFSIDALKEIIKFSKKRVSNRNKLDTNFNLLCEILLESSTISKINGEEIVSADSVKNALKMRLERQNSYEIKMHESILEGTVMIDTTGFVVGQINGLCVVSTNEHSFGVPTKITATTYIGREGVVNIEKEAELSGEIHEKGIGVIKGYLGERYAREFPLCLSSRICFEQSYGVIDGDSASSTELYAILSSLSNTKINQAIAVTGSVNQKGFIQPIGGVTEKVTGFYNICKKRGFTGSEGVIIPSTNVDDLVLDDEIIEALDLGIFSIYKVDTIEEAFEILTGEKMGELIDGKYEKGTVNDKIYNTLKNYYISARKKIV